MLNAISRFIKDESGLETVEWAIVGGVVVAVGAAIFGTIGGSSKTALTALDTEVGKAATAAS
jgi:Flp pilus assembly pilin Flp